MMTPNFKRTRSFFPSPAEAWKPVTHSAYATAVPVREMAAPALPMLELEDVKDAAEIARLLALPFPAFAQTVAHLLETLGYANVETMKAMHGRGKGRNQHGGYDLRMFLPTRLTRGLVIAQVKQYREPVPRSFVDELRGTMLRLGASQGLLVTTSTFSASAIEAAQAAQYAAPVRLMDGRELARLVRAHSGSMEATAETAPVHVVSAPSPTPPLRPSSRQKEEQKECALHDGQGAPPDRPASVRQSIAPGHSGPEDITLTLRVHLCLLPALPGAENSGAGTDAAGERGRP